MCHADADISCSAEWAAKLDKAGLEFGEPGELLSKLDELIVAAPDPEDSDEDSD